eukprot:5742812-Prymnesium_polylepis.2
MRELYPLYTLSCWQPNAGCGLRATRCQPPTPTPLLALPAAARVPPPETTLAASTSPQRESAPPRAAPRARRRSVGSVARGRRTPARWVVREARSICRLDATTRRNRAAPRTSLGCGGSPQRRAAHPARSRRATR